jgi:hypothetical protein
MFRHQLINLYFFFQMKCSWSIHAKFINCCVEQRAPSGGERGGVCRVDGMWTPLWRLTGVTGSPRCLEPRTLPFPACIPCLSWCSRAGARGTETIAIWRDLPEFLSSGGLHGKHFSLPSSLHGEFFFLKIDGSTFDSSKRGKNAGCFFNKSAGWQSWYYIKGYTHHLKEELTC